MRLLPALSVASALALVGCQNQTVKPPSQSSPLEPAVTYTEKKTAVSVISGYVWDPEAFAFSLFMCGADCALPPLTIPGIEGSPLIQRSLVKGAPTSLVDTGLGTPIAQPLGLTDAEGAYQFVDIPERAQGAPYVVLAAPPPTGVNALGTYGPPTLPPVPQSDYLPSIGLKPIYNAYTDCIAQSVLIASQNGVLQAVAKAITAKSGTTVTVADFVNPAKYGGVLVAWLYGYGPSVLRVPAGPVTLNAPGMTLYEIEWAPPGVLPPMLNQSARGFYVGNAAASPIGVWVGLLPALHGPPTPTAISVTDNIPGGNHPWTFPPLPPLVIAPGLISTLELQASLNDGLPPPNFICIAPSP